MQVFAVILFWFPQISTDQANYLAWLDFSVAIIIFLFDFANAFRIFLHGSDLFGVDTDDTETVAWFLIILPTVSKSKRIFMFYLLHSLALFYCPYQSG